MLSPCCREPTEHLSSSGGMACVGWGGARPTLCSAAEHSFLWAGRTPVDWGSNFGPGPGSRPPQPPPSTTRSGPLPCGPAVAGSSGGFLLCFWYLIWCLFSVVSCRWGDGCIGGNRRQKHTSGASVAEKVMFANHICGDCIRRRRRAGHIRALLRAGDVCLSNLQLPVDYTNQTEQKLELTHIWICYLGQHELSAGNMHEHASLNLFSVQTLWFGHWFKTPTTSWRQGTAVYISFLPLISKQSYFTCLANSVMYFVCHL